MKFNKSQKEAFIFAATLILLMFASVGSGTVRAFIVFETSALITLYALLWAKANLKNQDEKIGFLNRTTNLLTLSGALLFSQNSACIAAAALLVLAAILALLVDD